MPRIQVLDAHVVNQIAAGEVVERPASVVKELVENAIDAGADQIEVQIDEGGKALIEVRDNGMGMAPEDLERVFLPHATSKVGSVEDLTHVATLGFRGEALASIGSVARTTILSRTAEAEGGYEIRDDFGEIGGVRPTGMKPGTIVRVEHLFGRVPARRRFLRTPATESGHIKELMGRFALAFPGIGFRLVSGERQVLATRPGEQRLERIAAVFGDEVARDLLPVSHDEGDLSLEGFVAPPTRTRRDSRLEQAFVGGRFIRDKTITHATREAYRDLLPPGGQRPVAFLFLSCDPLLVDVNVHPAKAEVRWRDGQRVHRLIRHEVRKVLESSAPGVQAGAHVQTPGRGDPFDLARRSSRNPGDRPQAFDFGARPTQRHESAWSAERAAPPAVSGSFRGAAHVAEDVQEAARPAADFGTYEAGSPHAESPPLPESVGGLRPLGQALGTYLLFEGEDETLVVIDQHALHERVLFDQINARLREAGNLEVQGLLVPNVVHLSPAGVERLIEESEWLARLGWRIEAFGEDAISVTGVPALLRRPDAEEALLEILRLLERGDRDGMDRTDLLHHTVDSMACRGAIMAGDALHPDEALALLAQAEALNHSHSCPHGRPTRLVFKKTDLEKFFHRTV